MRDVAGQFLAEYLRLSVEDGDVVSNDAKAESDSISHQRELIARYVRDKGICSAAQPLEFVDDGYSGTNFDRPAVKEMLSMVREGKICCIIVKDISRFGRNYLEVGDYLEQIFPFMGVRFIAINDGYDSNDYIGTTGGIEIAFKSLLYDMYSKDLSEKMRSSLIVRRKRGDFIGPRAPFGYQFSDNKKVLAVDKTAAEYVKRIFGLACEGCKTGEIAKILNKEKIPTPGNYKNREKPQYHIIDGEGYWNSGKVRKVLQNKVYLGMVVNGKMRVTEIGGSHFWQVAEEEQICVPDRHEAIITEQEFWQASKVLKNNGCQKGKKHTPGQESSLLGKLRCGHCGRSLIRLGHRKEPCFTCKKAMYEDGSECIREYVSEAKLEAAVLEGVNQKLEEWILREEHRKTEVSRTAPDGRQRKTPEEIPLCLSAKKRKQLSTELEQSRDAVKIEKQYLYEQYKRNQMGREAYIKKIEALREEERMLCEQIQRLQEENEKAAEECEIQQDETEQYGKFKSLTKDVVEQWIDNIYVYGESRIDIIYKEKINKSKKSIKNY